MEPQLLGGLFPLAIFPEGSLASSVITTVWVGVWVVAFFNLRLGWVLSGLVVPGYLVPLILLEPLSAVVIYVEAAVTFLLVWLFSERLSGARTWSSLFGRDRFMALILTSIGVRLLFDGALLPVLGDYLNQSYDLGFDWGRDLESFGLIIVALMANQFWKPGLVAGMFTSLTTVLITLLIVRFGLMEFTNFRISDIGYLYELMASSFLASPKAYIILVTTAFIASRVNLRYGLDFNGILIPSLIALQWYDPIKILSSLVEAIIIYFLVVLVMRLPMFRDVTIEGAHKLLLFFNVSFAWKMLIGFGAIGFGFEFKTTDLYGFGYLLSTLIAMKMYERAIIARMTRGLLQISLQGAVVGGIIGFGLTFLSTAPAAIQETYKPRDQAVTMTTLAQVSGRVTRNGYEVMTNAAGRAPTLSELADFRAGINTLLTRLRPGGDTLEELSLARFQIASAGFVIRELDGGLLLVTSTGEQAGTFMVNPASASNLIVSVPDALARPGIVSAAVSIFRLTGARGLAINAADGDPTLKGQLTGTRPRETMYRIFHLAAAGSVLQVLPGAETTAPNLILTGHFPRGLDLPTLEAVTGELMTEWNRDPVRGIAGQTQTQGLASLLVDDQMSDLLVRSAWPTRLEVASDGAGIGGYVRGLTAAAEMRPAVAPPDTADLLYLRNEVLTPILYDILPRLSQTGPTSQADLAALTAVDLAAQAFDYKVRLFRDGASGSAYLVLKSDSNGWGTYAFSLGTPPPIFLQVPRPYQDVRTLSFVLSLNQRLGSSALLVAGPMLRDGRPDTDLDMLNPDRPPSLYDLVSKMLIARADADSLSVVLRAFVDNENIELPPEDVVLSFDRLSLRSDLSSLGRQLMAELEDLGLKATVADGRKDLAGYETGALPQAGYLKLREAAEFVVLWTSPRLRESYADRRNAAVETALFTELGVLTKTLSVPDVVGALPMAVGAPDSDIRRLVALYQTSRNPAALQQALGLQQGLVWTRLIDLESVQGLLWVQNIQGETQALINLTPLSATSTTRVSGNFPTRDDLRDFIASRAGWLVSEDRQ